MVASLGVALISGDGGRGVKIVCDKTLAKFVMELPESSYQRTRIHPHLSKHHIQVRYEWSIAFWLFWNSAQAFGSKAQIILAYMDEKWFYGIVVWKHNKRVPFLGVEPVSHSVHHKTHIHKTMAIATTAFLPFDNDMT
jgi:hypothetical protein